MTWLQLHGLGKSYGSAVACEHVDLTVVRGEFLTLLGASGCGKSTILRMIAGLATPDYGRIVLDGKDLTGIPVHRREAAMVFQSYALFPHLTVAQNVAFGLEARGLDRKIVSEKVKATLATVELGGLAERYPRQLSGGQQQRVAIARAIVTEPKLLLLDEPLSNLDAKLRDRLRIELRALQKRLRLATIYVTHDQAEAMSLSDRVAFMSGGRILEVGTPQEIYRRPRIRQTAEFIGEANIISGHLLRRENGRPIAQTPFGEVDITGETEGMEGDVLLCIRPEDIRLGPAERGALTGRVSHVAFMGALSDYIIAAPGGLTLRVQVPGPALAQAGESVTIALPATAPVIRQSAP